MMTNQKPKQSSLLNYVGGFIEKLDKQFRGKEKDILDTASINQSEFEHIPELTDIDLTTDPIIEIRQSEKQTFKQPLYLRRYQPPTPEPVDIQVQEVLVKPRVQQPPPVHVYVKPTEQRTPSPILIRSTPSEPPMNASSNELVIYNKYIPIKTKPIPQQIVIHRHSELPSKPRPVIVDQWLPNKPAPKRVFYRRINKTESKQPGDRYIEYKAPRTRIELEITRLPIIKLAPKDYQRRSTDFSELHLRDHYRSSDICWRI